MKFFATALAAVAAVAAVAATAPAQTSMGGMAMGSGPMTGMHAIPPPEQLPAPIRMTGIGNAHITIKATPDAQAWFDQGLNLLHDFWDFESTKAFEQAVRVDPQCAMCFWGLAQAEGFRGGPDKIYGDKALAEAIRLKSYASGTDKLYIEAAQAASQAKGNDSKEEVAIFRKLVKKAPHDLEARIFLANSLGDGYDDKGEPRPGKKEQIAILEGVLREKPDASAANHYWIHALEPGNHPELALTSAQTLAALAPTSGHMVHMPGHIFYRVGDYSEAGKWFAASTAADETYMREQHVGVDDDWNYVHNMMYAIANLMEQGRLADANALSDRLANARGELSASLYIWSTRDQIARLNNRLPVALRTGDWAAVASMLGHASLAEGPNTRNLRFLAAELTAFATGMQALNSGDAPTAEQASAHLDAGLWRMEQEQKSALKDAPVNNPAAAPKKDVAPMVPVMPDADSGPLLTTLSVASKELRAGVLVAQGKLAEGKSLYAAALKDERALGYHEPPFYIRPVGETEAAALLAAKDYAGAKAAYEIALTERPHSGFELYGLARVSELSGDQPAARTAYQAFLKAWPQADPTLPEITHARQFVSTTALASR